MSLMLIRVSWPSDHVISKEFTRQLENYWRPRASAIATSSSCDSSVYIFPAFLSSSRCLHMGHFRLYSVADAMARFYRLSGSQVTFPVGVSPFLVQLQSENVERPGTSDLKKKLEYIGCSTGNTEIDFTRANCYKWTQHLFLKLYSAGIISRRKALVLWDTVLQSVVGADEVNALGISLVSGAKVEKRTMFQWFFNTSRFAEDLYTGIESLMESNRQRLGDSLLFNWNDANEAHGKVLGPLDSYKFRFALQEVDGGTGQVPNEHHEHIDVCMKNIRDLDRLAFIVVRSTHALASLSEGDSQWALENGSLGYRLPFVAIHPLDGTSVPIFLSDTLAQAHTFDICPGFPDEHSRDTLTRLGLALKRNRTRKNERTILAEAAEKGFGGWRTKAKLQDWLVSRQLHAGTPIPVVHCAQCGVQPVPYEELPVLRPVSYSGATHDEHWLSAKCPRCARPATRETDTLDAAFDSSWIFLRALDANNETAPFSPATVNCRLPVDIFVAGGAGIIRRLFYMRLMCRALHFLGMVDVKEPVRHLLPVGPVLSRTYQVFETAEYLNSDRVQKTENMLFDKSSGKEVDEFWEKMSAAKQNVIDPLSDIESLGADVSRLLVHWVFPVSMKRYWPQSNVEAASRILNDLFWVAANFINLKYESNRTPWELEERRQAQISSHDAVVKENYNHVLRGVTFNFKNGSIENCILILRNFISLLRKHCQTRDFVMHSKELERSLLGVVIMMHPLAPFLTAELWSRLRQCILANADAYLLTEEVWNQKWPVLDADSPFIIEYYVNGKYCCRTTEDRRAVVGMSSDDALQKINQVPTVLKALRCQTLTGCRVEHVEDFGARIFITRELTKFEFRAKNDLLLELTTHEDQATEENEDMEDLNRPMKYVFRRERQLA